MRPLPRPLRATSAATVLAAVLLSGCGVAQEAPDPAATTTAGGVAPPRVELVTGAGAGGSVGDVAVPVTEPEAMEDFVAGLEPAYAARLRERVGELRSGGTEERLPTVLAQVVAVGCEPATSARLVGGAFEVVVPRSTVECRVAVTTVALAVAPDARPAQPRGGV